MSTHDKTSNGVFAEDVLLHGSRELAFQERVLALFALLSPERRLQVQWSGDTDCRCALRRYYAETLHAAHPADRRVRNERFSRYWRRMRGAKHHRELIES